MVHKKTGAMENLVKVTKKLAGEACNEGGMVEKGKMSMLENTKAREEKSDIRNWFKTKERLKKENIQQIKSEEDTVSGAEVVDLAEEIAEVVDLTEEITPSNSKEVDIQRGSLDEYLNRRLNLTRRDFQSLSGSRYINDKIIDRYLQLIRERNEADFSLPRIFTCITHLYVATVAKGVRSTVRWIKEDVRVKDLISFPIHYEDLAHWSLIAVETSTKTVYYFDSLENPRIYSMAPKIIKRFMEAYYKDKGETVTFRIKRRADAPLQENGYDCGVFLCQYAERIARKSSLNFSQKDLDLSCAREKMTQELLEERINPEWRMVNWVQEVWKNPKNRYENKEKGKGRGITSTVEKRYHCGKQKEIKSSAEKSGANKKESSQKEKPKATGEESKLGREERRKERINWPKANSKEWVRFDEDVTNILKPVHSSHENKAEVHPGIIFTI